MRYLDRSRDFARIIGGTFVPDGCDRHALAKQDGRWFDSHDREIVPGMTYEEALAAEEEAAEAEAKAAEDAANEAAAPFEALIAEADTVPWSTLHALARQFLGPSCPATKPEAIAALNAAAAAARAGAIVEAEGEGEPEPQAQPNKRVLTFGVMNPAPAKAQGKAPAAATAVPPTKAPAVAAAKPAARLPAVRPATRQPPPQTRAAGKVAVDLVGWGTGRCDYPFGEVRKTIQDEHRPQRFWARRLVIGQLLRRTVSIRVSSSAIWARRAMTSWRARSASVASSGPGMMTCSLRRSPMAICGTRPVLVIELRSICPNGELR
jgi:hypothetical protein